MILVGQPRVTAMSMKHLEQAVDEVLAVLSPLVAVDRYKSLGGEHCTPILRCRAARRRNTVDRERNCVEEAFEKCSSLRIGSCPIATSVRFNRLIEMPGRHLEAELPKQAPNLVVRFR